MVFALLCKGLGSPMRKCLLVFLWSHGSTTPTIRRAAHILLLVFSSAPCCMFVLNACWVSQCGCSLLISISESDCA